MPREFEEKRNHLRMAVEGAISYRSAGHRGDTNTGELRNLSGRGMMFLAGEAPALESELEVTVHPGNALTPPLHARVRVVRVVRQRRGERYEVGAVIKEVLGDAHPEAP